MRFLGRYKSYVGGALIVAGILGVGCAGTVDRVCSPVNYEQFLNSYVCPSTPELDPSTDARLIEATCEHAARAAFHVRAAACIGSGATGPEAFPL